jgi:hypothetical protein
MGTDRDEICLWEAGSLYSDFNLSGDCPLGGSVSVSSLFEEEMEINIPGFILP